MNDHRFLHMRIWQDNFNVPLSTKGGKTLCYREDDQGNIIYAIAKCSMKDNFCRRIGREVSLGRFNSGKTHIITIEQRNDYQRKHNETETTLLNVIDILFCFVGEEE